MLNNKKCRKCGISLTRENSTDGAVRNRNYICKKCAAEYDQDWAKHNLEKIKERRENYIKKIGKKVWRERCKIIEQRYRKSPKYNKEKRNELAKKWRKKLAIEVFTHYSGTSFRCACPNCYYHTHDCSIEFLTIDHINNNGAEQRREIYKNGTYSGRYGAGVTFYSWLKNHNFPEGYQVLCYNCNCGKQRNKEKCCPHMKE